MPANNFKPGDVVRYTKTDQYRLPLGDQPFVIASVAYADCYTLKRLDGGRFDKYIHTTDPSRLYARFSGFSGFSGRFKRDDFLTAARKAKLRLSPDVAEQDPGDDVAS